MNSIHPTAVVSVAAELEDCSIGPFAVIGEGVRMHGVSVGAHAVVDGQAQIGPRTQIFPHTVIGGPAQVRGADPSLGELRIGEDCIFREHSTVHRGSPRGTGLTQIGNRNLFMAGSHVAHDAIVGSDCTFANYAAIGGHVEIGDHATLGGMCGIHQHTRVGRLAMIAAGAICTLDIPPFAMAHGDRACVLGLNQVGLERAGISPQAEWFLAWRLLFGPGPTEAAIKHVRAQGLTGPEVEEMITFAQHSRRGIARWSTRV